MPGKLSVHYNRKKGHLLKMCVLKLNMLNIISDYGFKQNNIQVIVFVKQTLSCYLKQHNQAKIITFILVP